MNKDLRNTVQTKVDSTTRIWINKTETVLGSTIETEKVLVSSDLSDIELGRIWSDLRWGMKSGVSRDGENDRLIRWERK